MSILITGATGILCFCLLFFHKPAWLLFTPPFLISGKIGESLTRQLQAKGAQIVVLARDVAKTEKLFPGVRVVHGDTDKVCCVACTLVVPYDFKPELPFTVLNDRWRPWRLLWLGSTGSSYLRTIPPERVPLREPRRQPMSSRS
jgi:hypothetical protein